MLILITLFIILVFVCVLIADQKLKKRNAKNKFVTIMFTISSSLSILCFIVIFSLVVPLLASSNIDTEITVYEQRCEQLQEAIEDSENLSAKEIEYLKDLYEENIQKLNKLKLEKQGSDKLKKILFFED